MPGWTVRWSRSCHPTAMGTVLRRQQDGSWIPVTCPKSIISYNHHMGGVDHGDQLRGYYSHRTKSRKLYKYNIFTFFLDVATANSFIVTKHYSPSCPFANIKSFRLQLAKELIVEYCRRGRGGTVIHPLPYRYFPITMEDEKINDIMRHSEHVLMCYLRVLNGQGSGMLDVIQFTTG